MTMCASLTKDVHHPPIKKYGEGGQTRPAWIDTMINQALNLAIKRALPRNIPKGKLRATAKVPCTPAYFNRVWYGNGDVNRTITTGAEAKIRPVHVRRHRGQDRQDSWQTMGPAQIPPLERLKNTVFIRGREAPKPKKELRDGHVSRRVGDGAHPQKRTACDAVPLHHHQLPHRRMLTPKNQKFVRFEVIKKFNTGVNLIAVST